MSKAYLLKYKDEFKNLSEKEAYLESRISNGQLILEDVKAELISIRDKYSTPRICKVVKVSNIGNIPDGIFNIIITENNYVRKIGEHDAITTVKGDTPKFVYKVSNVENLILFDTKGRVFKLPIHKIPIMAKNDPGIDVKGVIKGLTADIVSVMYEPVIKKLANLKYRIYVAVLSELNAIKKLDIQDFINVPLSGITYSKIQPEDNIVSVQIVTDNMDVILYSDSRALRISSKDIVLLKRNTIGTLGMGGQHGPMEGMSTIYLDDSNPTTHIVVITKNGKVNKFLVSGFNRSQRNKAGSKVIDLAKGDSIKNIFGVSESNTISVLTTSGQVDIPVSSIQLSSSISKGAKLIKDTIIHVTLA